MQSAAAACDMSDSADLHLLQAVSLLTCKGCVTLQPAADGVQNGSIYKVIYTLVTMSYAEEPGQTANEC